jgi:hypothetical protein
MHRVPHHDRRQQQIQRRSGIELILIGAITDFALASKEKFTRQGI